MEITKRDIQIKAFLEKGFVADAETIKELFFPSLKPCQRRLNKLAQADFIQRFRENRLEPYLYYTDERPKNLAKQQLKTQLYLLFEQSNLRLITYASDYQLLRLNFDLLLFVENTHHYRMPILFSVRPKGDFPIDRMTEAFQHKEERSQMIKELASIYPMDTLIVVMCSPNPVDIKTFKHTHLSTKQLETDTKCFIQQLEQLQPKAKKV